MLSKYFEIKTCSIGFKNNVEQIISELMDKKIIIYGAGAGFFALDKIYNFKEKFNIVAISDKKFEKIKDGKTGLKEIAPNEITSLDYDFVLITNEKPRQIKTFLEYKLNIQEGAIKQLFIEEIKDESANLNYLYKQKFDKTLPKLINKLKGKKVVLYGAGIYLEVIYKYFDLSGLDIIGIADKRFTDEESTESFLGYKVYTPKQIKNLKPDYVIVATRYYIAIVEDLYYRILKNTGIKIRPLVKKSFLTLLKEIWK